MPASINSIAARKSAACCQQTEARRRPSPSSVPSSPMALLHSEIAPAGPRFLEEKAQAISGRSTFPISKTRIAAFGDGLPTDAVGPGTVARAGTVGFVIGGLRKLVLDFDNQLVRGVGIFGLVQRIEETARSEHSA